MKSLSEIEQHLETVIADDEAGATAPELLAIGETILEHWVLAKGSTPTRDQREGFRLLALHRQGAVGDPSFNACRETCRELAYHYNLMAGLTGESGRDTLRMMALVANHLALFVHGKMQETAIGDFCCAARPVRQANNELPEINDA